jgi:hypothetical protein
MRLHLQLSFVIISSTTLMPISAGSVCSHFLDLPPPGAHCHAVIRTPFDQLGKELVSTALHSHGLVMTEHEIAVNPRRIDVWFTPRSRQAALPDHLGLLGRILRRPCTVEFEHDMPKGAKLAARLIKHGDFRHLLSLDKTRTPLPHGERPRIPILWVVSAVRPTAGIRGLKLRRMRHWPSGMYEAAPLLFMRLVVVSELPVRRDTLLLRLLGADGVLRRALEELEALPGPAPERALAMPILLRLRLTIPTNPAEQTSAEQEFLMQTQDIVENWRREAVQEGLEAGVKQGLEAGVKQGVTRSLIGLYEARFGAIPDDVRAIIEDTQDEVMLDGWVKLAGTRSVDEVAAAIRATRPA